jgi:hypothetical protein
VVVVVVVVVVDGQDVGSLVCCWKFDMEAVEGEDITVLQVSGRGEAAFMVEGDGRAADRGAQVWPRERLPRDIFRGDARVRCECRVWAQGGGRPSFLRGR